MADKTTTNFQKVGNEAANVRVGVRDAGSPNLKYRPKGGAKGGGIQREKGAPGRANVQTNDNSVPQSPERLGAKWAPQMVMSSPQAPESQSTGRNVRLFRSAVGSRDFYAKRQYGQVQQ